LTGPLLLIKWKQYQCHKGDFKINVFDLRWLERLAGWMLKGMGKKGATNYKIHYPYG
jgi:hypothetical protein